MDQHKLSNALYILSSLALCYAAFMNSPMQFSGKAWENTMIPLTFFGIVIVIIIHVVYTGKLISQENYSKAKNVSYLMLIISGLIMIPGATGAISSIPYMVEGLFRK